MCLGIDWFTLAIQFPFTAFSYEILQGGTDILMNLVKKSKKLKILSWVLILCGIYFVFLPNRFTQASLLDFFKSEKDGKEEVINLDAFSRIPVLRGGRVKPMDSVARNTLLVLRNKRTALDLSLIHI